LHFPLTIKCMWMKFGKEWIFHASRVGGIQTFPQRRRKK
jgi:hypothetical protein